MIENELDDAYVLAKKGKPGDALEICNKLLKESPDEKVNILRKRSHIYAYINDIDNALLDRLEVIAEDSASFQDYFFSGVYLLELQRYDEAITSFSSSVAHSKHANNQSYLQESYLLRAYAYLGIGKLEDALSDCEYVDEDIEYHIEGDGPVSKQRLISYISKIGLDHRSGHHH